ncbi:MAG: bifunctional ADP-heptose synthase [Salibacteraceae bacterium]|nr:bifunctional ADP-heptose synthase [Salibacteraceae bacterium]
MNNAAISSAFERFKHQTILVIGDIIVDAYCRGSVTRVSPEAPVPILDIKSREYRLGGAANVALNIHGMGAKPVLCSIVGKDHGAKQVQELMHAQGLSTDGVFKSEERITSVKTRLMSGHHQLLRMDEEQTDFISETDRDTLMAFILTFIANENPDAIIFEDYDKGTIDQNLIEAVMSVAQKVNIPVTVDPKKRNFFHYQGATLFKPNMRELVEGLNLPNLKSREKDLHFAFAKLTERMPVEMAFFTLSADGVFITNGQESTHHTAHKRNIADVSGAGDTVISVATCALAAGLGMDEISYLSNLAGGYVCQFPGVVAISASELRTEFEKTTSNRGY